LDFHVFRYVSKYNIVIDTFVTTDVLTTFKNNIHVKCGIVNFKVTATVFIQNIPQNIFHKIRLYIILLLLYTIRRLMDRLEIPTYYQLISAHSQKKR